MSIYKGWKAQHGYAPDSPPDGRPEQPRNPSSSSTNDKTPPVHSRKSQPALTLLPRTITWMESLPADFRPNALAAKYARIANSFAIRWHSPEECHRYFDDLLIDRRGNRKGFPLAVMHDIQRLQRLYNTLHPLHEHIWLRVTR